MRNGRATPAEPATESPMPQDSTTTHEPVLSPEWSRDRSVVEQAGDSATGLRRMEHMSRGTTEDFSRVRSAHVVK